ncbi:MAG: N-acetylmuramoyl-L-alanine amidase [Chthoniobacter sp.]|uniref:N-acetylmuramoyl-L-alanine amidase n=1 Tax=Chthoniobacter sp. TaxID=2510640 RepID=UPI0032ADD167
MPDHLRSFFMSSIARSFDIASPESKWAHRWRRALIRLLPAVALFVLAGCESESMVKNTSHTFRTVVIDAGHGGHDMGTHSRWGGTEKMAALDTALRIAPKLRAAGFNTVLTRDSDFFVPLGGRTRISNGQDNAIFVSVHFNEGPNRAAHGVETYYRSKYAREIADRIQGTVTSLPSIASRGVKTANFFVLRHNEYPAVLVEGGFFSNPAEGSRCAKPAYHEALASAIAAAIIAQRGPLQPVQTTSPTIAATTSTPALAPATGPAPIPATR